MSVQRTDYLVIGGGVAGLSAAIELSSKGSVLVITKDLPAESSTEYAQGGIAAALSDEDSIGFHYDDTLMAGAGLCDEDAVKVLVEEGPRRVRQLIKWGAKFDTEREKLAFGLEGAHSKKRILRSQGDSTGREIVRVLVEKARSHKSIQRYAFTMVVDLIVRDGVCVGAWLLMERRLVAVLARATVLATGGGGQIYSVTTNPALATADGMAIAYRAGAIVRDMEFVQFHPTSLFHPQAPNFLLTEAIRGEGGKLKNVKGEFFMEHYHELKELAPRDIVSRAIISEMVRTSSGKVFLDLTEMKPSFVKKRFPKIYTTCLEYGIDITKEPVPVCPAAHYMMGGVRTDTLGAASLPGLYAAGEASCTGVHGANRLASNSLLEGLVYGARAGQTAGRHPLSKSALKFTVKEENHPPNTIQNHDAIRGYIRRLMWDKAGIIRCGVSLSEAARELDGWKYLLKKSYMTRRELELKNMLESSRLVVQSALRRKGSIGAHYRSDYPEPGRTPKRHIELKKRRS